MPSPNRRTLVIQPDLWEEVELRALGAHQSTAKAVDSMLRRYLELIADAAEDLMDRFTAEEVATMVGMMDAPGYRDLVRQFDRERFRHPEDAALDALGRKVAALTRPERMALSDLLERRTPVSVAAGANAR